MYTNNNNKNNNNNVDKNKNNRNNNDNSNSDSIVALTKFRPRKVFPSSARFSRDGTRFFFVETLGNFFYAVFQL